MGRHLRADRGLRRDVHRLQPRGGPAEGDHRPVRSLPMAPSAVLFGRTTSDVVINVISLIDHDADRPHRRLAGAHLGVRGWLASCRSWRSPTRSRGSWRWSACSVRTPGDRQQRSFVVIIFPLTFIANTFVPIQTLPGTAGDLRQLEPDLGGHPGRPRTLRQHQRGAAAGGRVADAAPGGLLADLDRAHPAGLHPGVDASVTAAPQVRSVAGERPTASAGERLGVDDLDLDCVPLGAATRASPSCLPLMASPSGDFSE